MNVTNSDWVCRDCGTPGSGLNIRVSGVQTATPAPHKKWSQTENFWRSGKCIQLKPSEKSRNVASHEKVSIIVEAIQHFDSKEVKAAIKGDLSGVESLEPNGKAIEPPAKFDYVAGPNQDDKGAVAFLQVGKRGIGKESLEFIVKCPVITVAYSGTNKFWGPSLTVETQIELASTQLKCVEDGTFEGAGQLTSKGKSSSDHSAAEVTGECHGAFEHTYAVVLVAQFDAADPSQIRVGIQGAGDQSTIGASEIALTDTLLHIPRHEYCKAYARGDLVPGRH